MFQSYFKQQKSSFNMLYDSHEAAEAAIEEYKAAVMMDGDSVLGEKINLTPQPQVSITVEEQTTGYIVKRQPAEPLTAQLTPIVSRDQPLRFFRPMLPVSTAPVLHWPPYLTMLLLPTPTELL